MHRRQILIGGMATLANSATGAQQPNNPRLTPVQSSPAPFAQLLKGGATMDGLPMEGMAERVFSSPAPIGPQGRWVTRASMPLPRPKWLGARRGRVACTSSEAMAKDGSIGLSPRLRPPT